MQILMVGSVQAAWVVVQIPTPLKCLRLSSSAPQFHSELELNSSAMEKHVLKHLPLTVPSLTQLLNQVPVQVQQQLHRHLLLQLKLQQCLSQLMHHQFGIGLLQHHGNTHYQLLQLMLFNLFLD
jgi:hypothetical protein